MSGILNKVYKMLKKKLSQDELVPVEEDSTRSNSGPGSVTTPITEAGQSSVHSATNMEPRVNATAESSAAPASTTPTVRITDIKTIVTPAKENRLTASRAPRLVENEDYYWEGRYMVMTAKYLSKRGYCCQSGCRHCPYGFRRGVGFTNDAASPNAAGQDTTPNPSPQNQTES